MSVQLEGDYLSIIIQVKSSDYEKFRITFAKLVNLNALGLIEMESNLLLLGCVLKTNEDLPMVIYFDKK